MESNENSTSVDKKRKSNKKKDNKKVREDNNNNNNNKKDKSNFEISDKQLFQFLWKYVYKNKRKFYLLSCFLIINVILGIIAPLLFKKSLKMVEESDQISGSIKLIIFPLIAYFAVLIVQWLDEVFQNINRVKLNSTIVKDIRIDTFSKLIKNKMNFFDNSETGILTSNITNDIQELSETGQRFVNLLTSFLRLFGIIIVLLHFSLKMTFYSLIFLPIFFLITFSLRKYQRNVAKRWRKNFGNVNQKFSETMKSIPISKAFAREDENIRLFTDYNEKTYKSAVQRGLAIFIIGPISDFFRNILLLIVLIVGTIENAKGNLDISTFYLFIFLINYYYYPLQNLAWNYNRFQSLFANLERILKISDDPSLKEIKVESLSDKSIKASNLNGRIKFNDVSFSYIEGKPILKNITFNVEPGTRVALVGHTGSGKTTIASLLMRFYEIEKDNGQILIDGIDIRNYELQSLRKEIGLVSQNVLLFKGTIRENLLLGQMEDDNISDDEIWQALDAVQARKFIQLLPNSLDSAVSEDGKNLSAGQRQMISFARVLLENPNIIVLDEATSAVDLYTESKIQEGTDLLLKGRSSIVIAHRLTTILRSDLIIVLDQGKIKQIGTHRDLVKQKGLYQEIYNLYFQTQSAEYLEMIKMHKNV